MTICSLATYLIKASDWLEPGGNLIHSDNISLDQMFQLGLGGRLVHWNPINKEQMPILSPGDHLVLCKLILTIYNI